MIDAEHQKAIGRGLGQGGGLRIGDSVFRVVQEQPLTPPQIADGPVKGAQGSLRYAVHSFIIPGLTDFSLNKTMITRPKAGLYARIIQVSLVGLPKLGQKHQQLTGVAWALTQAPGQE
jgi:hypothetical protein